MAIFHHVINDDCIRDTDNDNIIEEERVEVKTLFGIRFWKKTANETNEFVHINKRKLGF